MRKHVRDALAAIRATGLCVEEIRHGTRHLVFHIRGGAVMRLSRGTHVDSALRKMVAQQARRIAREQSGRPA